MLGHKLIQVLGDRFNVGTLVRSEKKQLLKYDLAENIEVFENIDIGEIEKIEEVIAGFKPNFIINAVGIIKQIPAAKENLLTLDVNSIFPQRLASFARKYSSKLITISTDCVFSGKKGNYTEEDISDADDLYGKSKFLGEVTGKNCLTLRTSIIGRELSSEHSLIEWFLSNKGEVIKGYKNAIYSGFPTIVLARMISNILEKFPDLEGLYHVSSDAINKYELLKLVKEAFELNIEIKQFEDFYIDRSLDSTKFRKLTGFQPLSWKEMIEKMANDPTPYDKWRNQIS